MPLYEYRCEPCDAYFEVSRSFKDSDVAAYCPSCDGAAQRVFSAPMTISRRGASELPTSVNPPPASASRWSHHGHSHGPGAGSHSH